MTLALIITVLVMIALLAFIAFRIVKDAPDRSELARLQTREQDYRDAVATIDERSTTIEKLHSENARLASDLENERKKSEEKLKLLQDSEQRLKTDFENLANRIFEEKGRVITDQNSERLSSLLQPFKEQLESFRKRVDEVHKSGTEQSSRMLEQVRQLQELSNKVSDDANNLAHAIKGDSKKQGDWGEVIVERIFEASGLEEGREYERQTAIRNEHGELRKPDFIVNLPGSKSVIVDSKVSLTAYERYCRAEDDTERSEALKAHTESVRKHVKELCEKDYSALLGQKSLDFVMMCIPLEPAYQLAMENDKNLVYDLGDSNVVVTGPATLLITIRLVAQLWRREHENKNAAKIAEEAGRMYDQVRRIVEAMEEARTRLGRVSESFELAMNRLVSGRGNLVGRVEKMRKLGAKVTQSIPANTIEDAHAIDDNEIDQDS